VRRDGSRLWRKHTTSRPGTRGQHVPRLREDVLDEGARDDAQGHLAVDAAESEVVDLVAEGRDVGTLRGVDLDGQDVLAGEVEVRRELERERRVAAPVLAEPFAVDPHGGRRHHALEVDEDVAAKHLGRKPEAPPVERDELRGLLAEAVPGQAGVGVRDDDALEARVVEGPAMAVRHDRPAEAPAPVHGQDQPDSRGGRVRPALSARQGVRPQDGSGQDGARALEKVASIHGDLTSESPRDLDVPSIPTVLRANETVLRDAEPLRPQPLGAELPRRVAERVAELTGGFRRA
jgi:hypothetical protein